MTRRLAILVCVVLAGGCQTPTAPITEGGSQLQLRQIQSRMYDTLDKRGVLRSIVATLQDLGFVIDKADFDLATITATKLQNYKIRMTVTVRERDGTRLLVRANARFNERPIEDPKSYQDFFVALDKAVFLTSQNVD